MSKQIRIGPAFFDSVSGSGKRFSRNNESFLTPEMLSLAPAFFLILFFGIIFIRLFYVQILRGEYYNGLADQNRTRTESIAAPRGIIFDRFARPLVANSPSFKIVNGNPSAGSRSTSSGQAGHGKTEWLTNDQALRLISDGKKVQNDILREYIYKQAFAHSIGYVGRVSEDEAILPEFSDYSPTDQVGKSGLEKQYEKLLHGINGKKLFEVDATGKKIRELGTDAPIPGKNLNTTLNRDVGVAVVKAMSKIERGAVVVSDPRDGGILAIYSSPAFDPNLFTHPKNYKPEGNYRDVESILMDGIGQPLLDRSISGAYPPGSTFKLVSATAALEEGAMKPDTLVEDTGVLKVGEFSFGNWYFLQHGRKDGDVDVVKAISRSNDIYFYKASEKTGVNKISNWARMFGLGKKFGIDLPSEVAGTVPTTQWKEKVIGEQWYLGDTFNYGIGQGYLLSTPLQVNMFTQVFANDGKLYKPHLILGDNKILKKDFIKSENINLIKKGMENSCADGGVAFPFFNFKVKNTKIKADNINYFADASAGASMVRVKVACKTGTAEIGDEDTKPHSWITVYAPVKNPEVVVTVLVENGGEGSSVAGPIARDILKDYFEKKQGN